MFISSVVKGQSLPGAPINLFVVSDSNNIGVQWEPPTETYGIIQKYIVSYAILPNITEVNTILNGDVTMALIAVRPFPGRLFKIRVSAENDAGIGPASLPKYVRTNCGKKFDISPQSNVTLLSPGFDDATGLPAGVLCEWNFETVQKYSLRIIFHELDLLDNSYLQSDLLRGISDRRNCTENYINITGIPQICRIPYTGYLLDTNSDSISILLKTSVQGSRGFKLTVHSDIRLPGPPTHIATSASDHAIFVAWDEPREITFPITAYHFRYGINSVPNALLIVVGANMRQFSINTDKYQGKIVHLNISAVIGEKEGQMSRTFYIRAPCVRRINVEFSQPVNISSPGYPSSYPSNVICVWQVTLPVSTALRMTFFDFRLEDTQFCSSDYITLSSDYPLQPRCSKMTLPMTLALDVNAFNLTFHSDNINEYPGFLIGINATERESDVAIAMTSPMTSSFIPKKITESDGENIATENNVTNITTNTHKHVSDLSTAQPDNSPETESKNSSSYTPSMTSLSNESSFTLPTTLAYYNVNLTQAGPTKQTSPNNSTPDPLASQIPASTPIKTLTSTTMTLPTTSIVNVEETTTNNNYAIYNSTSVASAFQSDDVIPETIEVTVTIVLSLVGAMLLVSLVIAYTCVRRARGKFRIHASGVGRISRPIELHDIIVNPKDQSQALNYSTFLAHAYGQTGNSRGRKPEPVCNTPEHANGWGYYHRSNERPRKRRYSFPCCFSAQQQNINREIDRTLASFAFIEDTVALESALYRKLRLRRTNSL
ncbi:hypothetical protein DPMN_023158 [Dreissena polymorpha]|uniref:Uncharacterized protein n=2 Tax=Dreissena polymorpha TaxID=45954 RepID=A0A9D4R9M9_DREPO|nr:hypothetical protein DPMN_023158 [Dreissena polymorpha]